MSSNVSSKNEQDFLARISELETELKQIKKQKKYGLVWENHDEDVVLQCQENVPILKEVKNRKISDKDTDKPTNILIEGDNYHALSVLNYTHKGKVDVIYIDPPYNTGDTSWKYNNNYIDINDQWRHSKWISWMNERLVIAKNILSQNGVLVCAIDHNELATLSLLLKEIFTEKEITVVTVIHNPSGIQGKNFSHNNEYLIFVYDGTIKSINYEERSVDDADVRLFMNTAKGKGDGYKRISGYNSFYPIFIKDNTILGFGDVCQKDFHPKSSNILTKDGVTEVYPVDNDAVERKWVFSRDSVEAIKDELSVKFNKKNNKYEIIRTKTNINYKTVWIDKKFNAKNFGTQLLSDILDNNDFSFPKSLEGVLETLRSIKHNYNSIVLDFFGGSGTTGHAVMKLNKEEKDEVNRNLKDSKITKTEYVNQINKLGNRQFILCTNNDVGKEKEELFKKENNLTNEEFEKVKKQNTKEWQNYCDKHGIASSITYERIKRVMKGYKNKKGEMVEGLGGNLRYFKTELCDVGKLSRVTDDKKLALTYRVGGLLALKENTFEETEHTDHWQIFSEHNKSTAVYFSEDKTKLHELIEKLGSYKTPVKLYVFSWSKNEYGSELSHYQHVTVSDIPEPILAVYREINNL